MAEERGQWGSTIGFVLAAMGAAIGFGSIARFPMNVANNGGAAFVLLYAIVMLVVGIPMLIAEFSLGREAQKNAAGAFSVLSGKPRTRWRWAGLFYIVVAGFFLSWYSVAAGWILRYMWASLTGAYFGDASAYQFDAVEGPDALFWHFVMMALTFLILTTSISKGIEKLNLVLMPMLFVIIIGLVAYAATLPNVGPGYAFYLRPDFSKLSIGVFAAVIGQAFFSLGVGLGSMMTYASYLSKKESLAKNAILISVSTLVFATLCGFMVFPLLSSFGMLDTGAAGLDLILGPLALAFAQMGAPMGYIVGFLFFTATFFAAFTSAVALAEPAIAYAVDEYRVDRRRAALLVCALIYLVGIVPALSTRILGLEGGALTDALVILGGLLIAIYAGWVAPAAKARAWMDESERGIRLAWFTYPLVRYVMPAILIVLLLFAILGTPCFLTGGAPGGGILSTFFGVRGIGC